MYEPDFELNAIDWATATGIQERYHGYDGLRAFTEEWTAQMSWPTFTATRVVDFKDRLLIEVELVSHGRASEAVITQRMGYVILLSKRGRIARLDAYWNPTDARAAVGLT